MVILHIAATFHVCSGLFRNVASELGRTLDSVLFEIDSTVTGDLHTLQNSTFNKECKLFEVILYFVRL